MFEPLSLVVMTPSETTLEVRSVGWVRVGLAGGGRISIWPGHAPLLGEVAAGDIRYATDSGEHSVLVGPGILHVARGQVTIYNGDPVDLGTVEGGYAVGAPESGRGSLAATVPRSPEAEMVDAGGVDSVENE